MKLARNKIFLACLLVFILGVAWASWWPIKFIYLYSTLLFSLVVFLVFWSQSTIRLLAIWGVFFVLGMIRLVLSEPTIGDSSHFSFYNGQDVILEAVVVEEPDLRLDNQKLTVKASDKSGRLLIRTALYPQYQYGDLLKITCRIEAPGPIEDFSYDKYLSRYDIYSVCWQGKIEKLDSGLGNPIKDNILKIKSRFIAAINQALPEPQASLLAGILIGARRGIPEYLLETFNRVGVTHIIAISGSNITIIAAALLIILQGLGISRRYIFWCISLGIGTFVIMTGASSSVVRAGIMGLFVLLASQLGRASRATNALVFTAFLMLLANPKVLVFDAGFQLSFLATMGIVYINPIWQERTKRWPKFLGLKEVLITTLSAITMTTPLILYQFERFSVVAPLANLLIVPLVPLVMVLGFAVGLVGLIWSDAGALLGWGAWVVLEYIIRVTEFLSSLSFASLNL